jgi:hypothetical protein
VALVVFATGDLIVALLWKMHAEADQNGLFAGDPSFNQLCVLSNEALPLTPLERLGEIIWQPRSCL